MKKTLVIVLFFIYGTLVLSGCQKKENISNLQTTPILTESIKTPETAIVDIKPAPSSMQAPPINITPIAPNKATQEERSKVLATPKQ